MVELEIAKQTKNWNWPLQVEYAKMEYSDADTICDCAEQTHTMDHLLKCYMLPLECTTEDLIEYNAAAKQCALQWMNNV